ncbi:Ldh family oxidoreductase [Candidatus Gracilibacteria bacterium]|nr:Ldh family oxidoreductase [Candidatus Gracilibacteria bacterium]
MKIKISELKRLVESKFIEKNISPEIVEKISDYLVWAEMSGKNTQGIVKMFGTEPLQDIVPQHEIKTERETPCSLLIDAGANSSIYTSQLATERVIEKAKFVGMAIVGVRNTFSSNGAQAYYLEQICKEGLIGFSCCRSPGAIAPFNSIDPLLGTNPMAFGFPTQDESIIFDMATSAITYYGLIVANDKGEKIDTNLAMDNTGEMTTNPKDAMDGAIYPFDQGYKSSNLAMMVELLSGPLLNSSYCDYKTFEEEWGSTFIAIDPNILLDLDDFKAKASDMAKTIKNSQTKDGDSVRLPGENSRKIYEESLKTGEVEIDEIYLEKLGYKF